MLGRLRGATQERWRAGREALAEPDLRRLNLAYLGSQLGLWAYAVAIAVYAFAHGGAGQVGLMTVVRLAPALLAAPFAGTLADRFPRRRVMIGVDLVRAGSQTLAAVLVIAGSPPLTVYLMVAITSLAATAFDPAKAALLPALAKTPEQLTAANALGATIESAGLTIGPALGGLLLTSTSVQVVLLAFAIASLWSAALVWRITKEPPRGPQAATDVGIVRRSLAGFTTIGSDHTLRTVVGVFTVQMLAFGLLNVFLVTIALNELHIGAGGVGWLNGAAGVGGIAGGLLTINLAGRRLATPLAIGMGLLACGYLLTAALSDEPVALAGMLMMNLGGCYVDIATFTLLQRAVDEAVLARAFSVIGTIVVGALLIGAALAPAMISLLGLRAALVVTGAVVLASGAAAFPTLRRIDATAPGPLEGLALLRGLALFDALPVPVLERLAADLDEQHAAAGEAVITQGQPGDSYYIIVDGTAEVLVDDRLITTLAAGEAFGEIALLLDTPRTGTVRAQTDMRLARLERDTFLAAVSGHEPTHQAGHAQAQRLLTRAQPANCNF